MSNDENKNQKWFLIANIVLALLAFYVGGQTRNMLIGGHSVPIERR